MTRERKIQQVMRAVQKGRICSPGTCQACRAFAERIVDSLARR